jgi:hypothetical protein
MSVALTLEADERAAIQERIRLAKEASRAAAESGDLDRKVGARDLDGTATKPARKGPYGADAGPHKFDEAAARAALKEAPTYDDACYAYNAATGAFLAPGDFQARCRAKGLARPGRRYGPPPIPPPSVGIRDSPRNDGPQSAVDGVSTSEIRGNAGYLPRSNSVSGPGPGADQVRDSPAAPPQPAPVAAPVATPEPAGRAARVPWVKPAMRAACEAAASWPDATARYNAATGQTRTWQRFQICCLTGGIRPDYPRKKRVVGNAPADRPARAAKPAPAPIPAGDAAGSPPPAALEPIPQPAADRLAADPPLGPVRAPVALDRDWELFLAGLHLVSRFGLGPATLRRIADVLEATKGVTA